MTLWWWRFECGEGGNNYAVKLEGPRALQPSLNDITLFYGRLSGPTSFYMLVKFTSLLVCPASVRLCFVCTYVWRASALTEPDVVYKYVLHYVAKGSASLLPNGVREGKGKQQWIFLLLRFLCREGVGRERVCESGRLILNNTYLVKHLNCRETTW